MSEHTSVKAFTQFRSFFCSLVFDPELTLGQVTSDQVDCRGRCSGGWQDLRPNFQPTGHAGSLPRPNSQRRSFLPCRRRQIAGLAHCTRLAEVLTG